MQMRVTAPLAQVWSDWTEVDGLEAHFAPKAFVDLRPGGTYEIWFRPEAPKGQRGAEDGIILGLESEGAQRMLHVTWRMPPYMPDIVPHKTVVQMWFEDKGDGITEIRLYHSGFGHSPVWQEAVHYFMKVWSDVFAHYKAYAISTPDD